MAAIFDNKKKLQTQLALMFIVSSNLFKLQAVGSTDSNREERRQKLLKFESFS